MDTTIGERIKMARKKAGLTQKELAKAIGLSNGAIVKYENNEREPRRNTLIAIAKTLGVKESYFYEDEATTIEVINTKLNEENKKLLDNYQRLSLSIGATSLFTLLLFSYTWPAALAVLLTGIIDGIQIKEMVGTHSQMKKVRKLKRLRDAIENAEEEVEKEPELVEIEKSMINCNKVVLELAIKRSQNSADISKNIDELTMTLLNAAS